MELKQSGLGLENLPFGWGNENLTNYALKLIDSNNQISARRLANKIVNMANKNDGFLQ
jgi:hypothetical protein